ncbi:LppU/SCO3897 family protein [Actinokineospora sp. HUAS TT18]|uniref:LppU/SCO3897 family protein n=1 Tax=Actinokineospora sp. HUAS TT18 TaxID=3447451 RepID=UPI003F51C9C8
MSTDMPAIPPAPEAVEPEQKKSTSVGVKILRYVGGLAVAALLVYGFNYFTSDAAQAKAGDCAAVAGTTSKPDFKTVDCGAAEANYTIGKVLSKTSESCGGTYDEYIETGRGPDSKLCLVPKLVEGTCYDTNTNNNMGMAVVDCGKPDAVKITKLLTGVEDKAQCPDSSGITFPEPKLTICFGPGVEA